MKFKVQKPYRTVRGLLKGKFLSKTLQEEYKRKNKKKKYITQNGKPVNIIFLTNVPVRLIIGW